jgi:CRISPR-associated endonuclease/helicase Cas3
MEQSFIARITDDGRKQTLLEHADRVAKLSRKFAETFEAGNLAEVIGLYHDFGKATPAFQAYISNPTSKRGEVKHSIYGAKYIDSLSPSLPLPITEILSNCIASHHGCLRDYLAPDGDTPLSMELMNDLKDKPSINYTGANLEILSTELKSLLALAPDKGFAVSMLTKLLYSCLVDADRLDAYLFESGETYCPKTPDWVQMLRLLEAHLAKFASEPRTEMASLREKASVQCLESGLRERGIYQLNLPTGGGKTLSSLRFAIPHAQKHGMSKIIYVIPYLSILEQTAKTIRTAINVSADDITVLEHHSNILPDNEKYYKLHTDRWDAPIILTTQVQFLESVFSAKGSDLRKLHNMTNSIIIFDEVQSLPINCVHLFNNTVNFLHKVCKSTILLCTATQPLLDKVSRPVLLSDKALIADCGTAPKRTKIIYALRRGGYTFPELAKFVLKNCDASTLVIVNTKAAAKALFRELKNANVQVLHLSTNMYPAHRDKVITEIKERLGTSEHFVCVSTQLIEAGVDISFSCVVRDIAGLDSIYQAAGRCNRHGEYEDVKNVYVVNIRGEKLDKLPDIKIGAEITQRLFDGGALDTDEYYRHYFHARKDQMDYPIDGGSVYDLLTNNRQGYSAFVNRGHEGKIELRAAIRSAAENFYVIAPGQTGVVVLDAESKAFLDKYTKSSKLSEKRHLLRTLGRYTVSMYKFQLDELKTHGALMEIGGLCVLCEGFYDKEFGINFNGEHKFLCD